MLWVPVQPQPLDSEAKRLIRRAAPLTFGYFGAIRKQDDLEFCTAGSGVFTHPYCGLTAKHVGRQVLALDGRDRIPKYSFRTQHSASLFQHLNPFDEQPLGSLWHVTRAWDSPLTDITLLQISAGEETTNQPSGYFSWRLLPPPVGAKVHLLGFPGSDVTSADEDFYVRSTIQFISATVTAVYPLRRPDGAPPYPCFEIDKAVDGGFSGGGVFYDSSLCGLVSMSSTFEEKTWCVSLWPLALMEYDSELAGITSKVSDLFTSRVINAVDWTQVRGKIARRENEFGEPFAFIDDVTQ